MIRNPSGSEDPSRSPATRVPGVAPAYEIKFLLGDEAAAGVEGWARRLLTPDPHGDPAQEGRYSTTTLYCDTPELDVYFRTPSYRRRKFRIRRYGLAPWVYLERKSRRGDRVRKRRAEVAEHELTLLDGPAPVEKWAGNWFHRRLLAKRQAPACRVSYRRTAFIGACPEGPLRLTLDRGLRGAPAANWSVAPVEDGRPLLAGGAILELKFLEALPKPFKTLIQEFRLTPSVVSKYRLCREAWGAPPVDRGPERA